MKICPWREASAKGRELPFGSRADSGAVVTQLEIHPRLPLRLLRLVAKQQRQHKYARFKCATAARPSPKVSASLLWPPRTFILGLCCRPASHQSLPQELNAPRFVPRHDFALLR